MPISQLPCAEIEVGDIQLVFEDWATSLLPQFFKSGIPLCAVHASMYHSLRVISCVCVRVVPKPVLWGARWATLLS